MQAAENEVNKMILGCIRSLQLIQAAYAVKDNHQ